MNCKPGDLAVIVVTGSNTKNNLGRIVKVLERAPDGTLVPGIPHDPRIRWVYEPKLKNERGDGISYVNDCCLRPIRPGDISDEEVRDLYAPKVPEHA